MIKKSMRAYLLIVMVLATFLLGGCGVGRSGLEVISSPIAKVYLNGKESGMTPYKNNSLETGNVSLKLDDDEGNTWEREIELENNVTTVVNWNFNEDKNSGYILSMERTGENGSILVNSNPGGAIIYIDNEVKMASPAKIENVSEGDKKVSIVYPGYKSINLIVKMVKNYQLVIDAKLERERGAELNNKITPTPTGQLEKMIKIKETETGWLRVRASPSNNGTEIGRVKPGDNYKLISEDTDWYQISFENKDGWISSKYAEKI